MPPYERQHPSGSSEGVSSDFLYLKRWGIGDRLGDLLTLFDGFITLIDDGLEGVFAHILQRQSGWGDCFLIFGDFLIFDEHFPTRILYILP
jgi:hypothetical protein